MLARLGLAATIPQAGRLCCQVLWGLGEGSREDGKRAVGPQPPPWKSIFLTESLGRFENRPYKTA